MVQQNNKNDNTGKNSKNKFFKNSLLTFSIKNYEKKWTQLASRKNMLAVYKLTYWLGLLDTVIGAVYWFSLVGTQNEGRIFGSDANPLNEMHLQLQED